MIKHLINKLKKENYFDCVINDFLQLKLDETIEFLATLKLLYNSKRKENQIKTNKRMKNVQIRHN